VAFLGALVSVESHARHESRKEKSTALIFDGGRNTKTQTNLNMTKSKYCELSLDDTVPTDHEDVVFVDGEEVIFDTMNRNEYAVEEAPDLLNARRRGAGVLCGLLGCLLCGPILALITGGYAAYATSKDGAIGDAARAIGDVALTARDKAKEVDEKHDIVGKTKVASRDFCERVKAASREFTVRQKLDAGTNLVV
jgi:hypothetical protein